MNITHKQAIKFLEAYMNRYADKNESQQDFIDRMIGVGVYSTDEIESKFFLDTVTNVMPKRTSKKLLNKISSQLYMNYGPKILTK